MFCVTGLLIVNKSEKIKDPGTKYKEKKMNEALNEFGKTFIKEVRDRTIHDVDSLISGAYKSEDALK